MFIHTNSLDESLSVSNEVLMILVDANGKIKMRMIYTTKKIGQLKSCPIGVAPFWCVANLRLASPNYD
jgi:hypothetical protein